MEQNQFKCSGDCLNCRAVNDRRVQWQYCAAQFSYNALRTMQTMQDALSQMSGEIADMKSKIEAIQDSEASVFAPDTEEEHGIKIEDIAHIGDGAEIDAPIQLNNIKVL